MMAPTGPPKVKTSFWGGGNGGNNNGRGGGNNGDDDEAGPYDEFGGPVYLFAALWAMTRGL